MSRFEGGEEEAGGGEESETLKKRINLSVYKPFTVTYLVRPVQSSLLSLHSVSRPILRLTQSLSQPLFPSPPPLVSPAVSAVVLASWNEQSHER